MDYKNKDEYGDRYHKHDSYKRSSHKRSSSYSKRSKSKHRERRHHHNKYKSDSRSRSSRDKYSSKYKKEKRHSRSRDSKKDKYRNKYDKYDNKYSKQYDRFSDNNKDKYSSRTNNYKNDSYQQYSNVSNNTKMFNDLNQMNSNITKSFLFNQNGINPQTHGQDLPIPKWHEYKLPPIENISIKLSKSQRSYEEVQKYRKKKEIFVTSTLKIPDPFIEFEDCSFPSYIRKAIDELKFQKPTPIQAQSWPILVNGDNLIGIAQTGSGKTLSYIVPAIMHLNAQKKSFSGPQIVILAPTRELVQQIEKECQIFSYTCKLRVVSIYGGVKKYLQIRELQQGCDILVACPGRLIDFLIQKTISLLNCSFFILDEADKMLDMGFEPQLRVIHNQIRPDRRTCLWSATWPKVVQQLAYEFCKDPIHLKISETENSINVNIEQRIVILSSRNKLNSLISLLKSEVSSHSKVLIFCQTKKQCEELSRQVYMNSFRNLTIHGKKDQEDRDYIIKQFKNSNTRILIATDIVGRGLDIKDIDYVINYDFPMTIEQYIHRIGRTGRAGESGISVSFFCEDDERLAKDLINVLKQANQKVPSDLQQIYYSLKSKKQRGGNHSQVFDKYQSRNSFQYQNKYSQHSHSLENKHSSNYSHSGQNDYKKPYDRFQFSFNDEPKQRINLYNKSYNNPSINPAPTTQLKVYSISSLQQQQQQQSQYPSVQSSQPSSYLQQPSSQMQYQADQHHQQEQVSNSTGYQSTMITQMPLQAQPQPPTLQQQPTQSSSQQNLSSQQTSQPSQYSQQIPIFSNFSQSQQQQQ